MTRKFSLWCTFVAVGIALLLFHFFFKYYAAVQLQLANTLTRIVFWLIVGFGVIATLVLLTCKAWVHKNLKKLLFSFSLFILGAVVIECTLRIADNRPLRFSPHQYLNYIGTPNYKSPDGLNMHNSLGFRGSEIEMPKPKGRIRIAILGGSTTYEDYVKDWKQDFARRLQFELRKAFPNKDIEVINAGLPGWDSWEDLINLEFRLLDLDLNMIIVYEGTNEVHTRLVKPAAFTSDNSGSKKQWERKACFDPLCLKIVQKITGLDAYGFDINAPTAALFPMSNDYNVILGMTPMEALDKNTTIYSERNLRNIIAVARENNIKVMLATWAWTDQLHDYAATAHYQRGFREENDVIKKVAAMKNVSLYDFASDMPKDKKYWGDGRHNNQDGVNLKALLFSDFILTRHALDDMNN